MVRKLNKYAILYASILTLVSATPALAQSGTAGSAGSQGDEVIEEVIVTGIRGSLRSALDTKRSADQVVDAISAEDIGKFPDQNIAEALQRITGVAIQRDNGEGRFITVRGLGPDFNVVTFNGRTMATENSGRAFSFDIFASELISGAEVIKTPSASTPEGSIGAAVNVTTAKPSDLGEFATGVSVSAYQNDLEGDWGPWVSGLISKQFNDTVGGLLSVAYSDVDLRTDQVVINGHYLSDVTDADTSMVFTDVRRPRNYNQSVRFENRERLGLTGALQFRPNDNLDIVVDGVFTDFDVTNINSDNLNNLAAPGSLTLTNVSVDSDSTLNTATYNGHRYQIAYERIPRTVESYLLGANASWSNDGPWAFEFDIAYSEAEADDRFGSPQSIIRSTSNRTASYDASGSQAPDFVPASDILDPTQFISFITNDFGRQIKDEVFEVEFTTSYYFDGFVTSLDGGIQYTDRKKTQNAVGNNATRGSFLGTPVPESVFDPFPVGDFMSESSADIPREWLVLNPDRYEEFLRSTDPDAFAAMQPTEDLGNSGTVSEEILSAFVQVNFAADLGNVPVSGNIGVRVPHTDQLSTGYGQAILAFDPDSGTFTVSDTVPLEFDNDYTDVLPSLNIRFDLTDDVILRVAAAETLTRPTLDDLLPAQLIIANPGSERIIGGNPLLLPVEAVQFDAALEWYFSDISAVSVAYFYKDIENLITNVTEIEVISGVEFEATRPRNSEGATINGLEFAYQQVFEQLPSPMDGLGIQLNYTYADSVAQFDNIVVGSNFPAEGVSENSYNVILFYEKGSLSARAAYNYRDEFLENSVGLQGNAEFVDSYGQIDASISWGVTDSVAVFFEGINLTDEEQYKYSDIETRLRSLTYTGRRLQLGARVRF